MEKLDKSNHSQCTGIIRPVQDALDVLNGKWKLPIIVALLHGYKRFSEISRQVPGITDRMLSKELRDLELNHLVKRSFSSDCGVHDDRIWRYAQRCHWRASCMG